MRFPMVIERWERDDLDIVERLNDDPDFRKKLLYPAARHYATRAGRSRGALDLIDGQALEMLDAYDLRGILRLFSTRTYKHVPRNPARWRRCRSKAGA